MHPTLQNVSGQAAMRPHLALIDGMLAGLAIPLAPRRRPRRSGSQQSWPDTLATIPSRRAQADIMPPEAVMAGQGRVAGNVQRTPQPGYLRHADLLVSDTVAQPRPARTRASAAGWIWRAETARTRHGPARPGASGEWRPAAGDVRDVRFGGVFAGVGAPAMAPEFDPTARVRVDRRAPRAGQAALADRAGAAAATSPRLRLSHPAIDASTTPRAIAFPKPAFASLSEAAIGGIAPPRADRSTEPTASVAASKAPLNASWQSNARMAYLASPASVAPAAPRLPGPPPASSEHVATADRSTRPQPPEPAPQATSGDVFLDGARVGRWMARSLGREAARPPAAGTAFDPRLTPAWSAKGVA